MSTESRVGSQQSSSTPKQSGQRTYQEALPDSQPRPAKTFAAREEGVFVSLDNRSGPYVGACVDVDAERARVVRSRIKKFLED